MTLNSIFRRAAFFLPCLALLGSGCIIGGTISRQGIFLTDDQVQLYTFALGSPGQVTLRTFSYAGGTNGNGQLISRGGFDPVLTLFDGSGNFLNSNNDGPCGTVGIDAITLNCFDSYLSRSLGPGSYTVALTESDNLPVGPTLADGFTMTGQGNFTCPEFLGRPGPFCDASPSQRLNTFALDITTLGTSPVPEPRSAMLLLIGSLAIVVSRRRSVMWIP